MFRWRQDARELAEPEDQDYYGMGSRTVFESTEPKSAAVDAAAPPYSYYNSDFPPTPTTTPTY